MTALHLVRSSVPVVFLTLQLYACGSDGSSSEPGSAGAGGTDSGGGESSSGGESMGNGGTNSVMGGSAGTPSGGETNQAGAAGSAGAGGVGGANAVSICPDGPFADSPLPSANVSAQSVCTGFRFTEGPVWVASEGALLFSDFEHGSPELNFTGDIIRYEPGGGCETFISDTGTNGLALSTTGSLLGASHLSQTINEYDLGTKQGEPIISDFEGNSFSSPNDLTVHSNGTIYFTDPAWEIGNRNEELPQAAYYLPPGGQLAQIDQLNRPNGITLSPDESRLYIAVIGDIRVYDLDADGVPSNDRSFVGSGSDGMVVDCAGNLYLTAGGVQIYSPDGQQIGSVSAPNTTNVAFGGADRQTLYITGGTQLYSVDLEIPGYPY